MAEKFGDAGEMILDEDDVELFDRQVAAMRGASVWKQDAKYQNKPKGDQQCDRCSMYVPDFTDDIGYCTKVRRVPGPIFADGWCKFFEPIKDDADLAAEYSKRLEEESK